jgi:copper resistance protein B
VRRELRLIAVGLFLWGPPAAHAQEPSATKEQAVSHPPAPPPPPAEDPSGHEAQAPPLPPFIARVTEADREAAFPDVHGHATHDNAINYFVLFDQFEGQTGDGRDAFSWDTKGWVGRDRDRLWFRSEGDHVGGDLEQAQTHLLYGRAVARWWDVTAGVRLDTLPDTPRSAVAFGVQGLAPYWFEVEASAFVEFSGRTHVRLETEYDLRITNRLVLQPLVEMEIYASADEERGIDTGLSTGELGLRLRYEFRREFAPYLGVVWTRKFFGTADYAAAAGEPTSGARLAAGVRFWM